jgi:hypothetical protein
LAAFMAIRSGRLAEIFYIAAGSTGAHNLPDMVEGQ